MNRSEEIELRWIFSLLLHWLWLIAGFALLAVGLAYFVTTRMTLTYRATATLYIESARDSKTSEYNLLIAGERLAQTYSQMVKDPAVLRAVIDQLGLKKTTGRLGGMITAAPVANTQLIRLTVVDTDPQQAASIANTVAEALVNQVRNLQTDRYTNSLTNTQKSLDELAARIKKTEADIDLVRAKKIETEAEITRKQDTLTQYGNAYRSSQQSYQDLLLTINQQRNKINLVEAAHVTTDQIIPPYTAVATFLLPDERLARTYGEILAGRQVLEAAIQKLNLQITPEELGKRVSVNPILNTQLIQLNVDDSVASQATHIAEAISSAFIVKVQALLADPYTLQADDLLDQLNENLTKKQQVEVEIETLTQQDIQNDSELARLQNSLNEDRSDYQSRQSDYEQLQFSAAQAADSIILSSAAQVPNHATQSRQLYLILGGVVGMVLGVGAAFLIDYLDDTIKTSEDITQQLGLSTVGVIDTFKAERGIVVNDQPRSSSAEAFRLLATNIRYSSLDKRLITLLVTSAQPQEGKSLIASNLAAVMAQGESSVVLIDADLRLPKQHKRFEIEQGMGLTESLLQNSVNGNLQPSRLEKLNILTSGELPPNPSEVIASDRMRNLINELTKKADKVVVDSPPILVAADAKTLATQVDGVLLVVRAGQTTFQAAREAIESLRQVNANLVGVILNGVRQRNKGYSYYRYHEGQRNPRSFSWKGWMHKLKTGFHRPAGRKPARIPWKRLSTKIKAG